MNERQEKHYKETTPEATVEHLLDILKKYDIEMEEFWLPQSSIGTYSLRVFIKGTPFGSNGKGVTKEFARASAYAEFFERFQNNLLDLCCAGSDNSYGFRHYADEKIVSVFDIVKEDNTFMRAFYKRFGLENASFFEKVAYISKYYAIEPYYCNNKPGYELRPYYNVTDKKIEYLPFAIVNHGYGSNGMCAGNSSEEALTQGMSEIFERYVQKRAMKENISFPNVPEEVIQRWPYVYEMYRKAKSMDGYYVAMKDCSMGGKFSVAALLIVQKNTGKWGIKLGAHPDFGIAMERTLTEATQGVDLDKYCNNNTIDFTNTLTDDEQNIFNSYKCGVAHYPYQFLSEKSTFEPWDPVDVSGKTNGEILASMIKTVEDEGFSVYIRDMSYSGFPSFQIIVPGMSELVTPDEMFMKLSNAHISIIPAINDPKRLTDRDVKVLAAVLEEFSISQFVFNLTYVFHFCRPSSSLPAETPLCNIFGPYYLRVMAFAYLEDYKNATRCMFEMVEIVRKIGNDVMKNIGYSERTVNLWNAMLYYFSAMDNIRDHKKTMEYMYIMYDKDIADELDELFADPKSLLVKQYPPRIIPSYENPDGDDCEMFHNLLGVTKKLKEMQLANPIDQASLAALFE